MDIERSRTTSFLVSFLSALSQHHQSNPWNESIHLAVLEWDQGQHQRMGVVLGTVDDPVGQDAYHAIALYVV